MLSAITMAIIDHRLPFVIAKLFFTAVSPSCPPATQAASALAEQAQGPFLNPQEHGFADAACVVNRACTAPYGGALEQLWPGSCAIAWPADIDSGCATDGFKAQLAGAERAKVVIIFDRIALGYCRF